MDQGVFSKKIQNSCKWNYVEKNALLGVAQGKVLASILSIIQMISSPRRVGIKDFFLFDYGSLQLAQIEV